MRRFSFLRLSRKNFIQLVALFLVFSLGIASGIGVYAWKISKDRNISLGDSLGQLASSTLSSTASVARLVRQQGQVFLKEDSKTDYSKFDGDQTEIANNTTVKTDNEGLAFVLFPDKSLITIDSSTELQVKVSDKGINILQLLGNAWYRVASVAAGKEFKTQTPTSLASVRGTKYGVLSDLTQSELVVLEGKVDVGQSFQGNMFDMETVTPGQHIVVPTITSGKPTLTNDIPDNIKNSNWYKKNQLIDKYYDEKKTDEVAKIQQVAQDPEVEKLAEPVAANLIKKYKDTDANPNPCKNIKDIDSDKKKLDTEINERPKNVLTNAMNTLQNACSDGILTNEEKEQYDTIVNLVESEKELVEVKVYFF